MENNGPDPRLGFHLISGPKIASNIRDVESVVFLGPGKGDHGPVLVHLHPDPLLHLANILLSVIAPEAGFRCSICRFIVAPPVLGGESLSRAYTPTRQKDQRKPGCRLTKAPGHRSAGSEGQRSVDLAGEDFLIQRNYMGKVHIADLPGSRPKPSALSCRSQRRSSSNRGLQRIPAAERRHHMFRLAWCAPVVVDGFGDEKRRLPWTVP